MKPKPVDPSSEGLTALAERVAEDILLSQPKDDVVLMVCEQTGWNWDKAENFVQIIEAQNLKHKLKHNKIFLLRRDLRSS